MSFFGWLAVNHGHDRRGDRREVIPIGVTGTEDIGTRQTEDKEKRLGNVTLPKAQPPTIHSFIRSY